MIVIACAHGCANSGSAPQPSLPWNRQTPPATASSASSARSAFLSDWMRHADQQENLAESQRRRIAELERLQAEQEQRDRLLAQQQREREREALSRQYAAKEQKLLGHVDRFKGQASLLQDRAGDLDSNNRDLHAEIARRQKENSLLKEELGLVRQRLRTTAGQLAQTQQYGQESERRLRALQASTRQRAGASITANSSLTQGITAVMVPGMDVRQDGDLVRIAVPSEKLFMLGTASLHQGSQPYMDQVARVLSEHYPRQMVGIEAHTDDNQSIAGTQWRNQHQLTSAQAMAVFEQLTSRRIDAQRLFVIGHGGNHPKFSGGTPQGQTLNRRVEVVVYPETYPPN